MFIPLQACIQKQKDESNGIRETRIFKKYLKDVFSIRLKRGDIIIVIPDHPCSGCIVEGMALFKTYENEGARLIITPPRVKSVNMKDKNILLDSMGKVNDLNLPLENASLILMGKDTIDNILYTTPDQNQKLRTVLSEHIRTK